MDTIIQRLAILLVQSATIILASETTQLLPGRKDQVLWDSRPLMIDEALFKQFEQAIKKRGIKYYTRSDVLSYPHFCLALLCASKYSLNHTITPSIPARAYTAAWRGIVIVAATGHQDIVSWLSNHTHFRTAEGYCNKFALQLSAIAADPCSERKDDNSSVIDEDETVLSSVTFSEDVKRIEGSSDNITTASLHNESYTPEGQLHSLLAYCEMSSLYRL